MRSDHGHQLLAAAANVGGRGRRRRKDKGLPPEAELLDLAKTYLGAQRRLWPELAGLHLIPPPAEGNLAAYADAFRRRFPGEPGSPGPWEFIPPGATLAVGYVRFSSANSDPRSLDQGRSPAEAAREAGCSEMTVRRVIKERRETDRSGGSAAA